MRRRTNHEERLKSLLGLATATPLNIRNSTTSTSTSSSSAPYRSDAIYYDDVAAGDGRRFHRYFRPDLCVAVTGGYAGYGAAVDAAYCQPDNTTWSELMSWNRDEMRLSAGDSPSNGGPVTIEACGGSGQTWKFSEPNKIELSGTDFCLEVQEGSGLTNQKPYSIIEVLQVWKCEDDNNNQLFYQLSH
ncbi:hypothetical protein IAR50_003432 [Cryptococcus sp. DSM 104548]